jgi:tetratricopeptide (TPR) repeat protein
MFRRGRLKSLPVSLLVVALLRSAQAQTYKVGGAEKAQQDTTPANREQSLGWGSSIQNARLARAAEEALKSQNYAAAVDYAQRAADSAPNNPRLWFLLGYAARLAKKSQLSIDAFNHGLRLDPASLEGTSGLAQTYSSVGRRQEAEVLLTHVLAADPKRTADAALLGEIQLQSGQYDQALKTLQQAEQTQASARTELLIALCYERLKQPASARRYLEAAERRAPDNPDVQRSLAAFYRETGNCPAAIGALKAISHKSPDVTAELAYTDQICGRPDESAQLYAEAADAAPDNLDLQLSAAQAWVSAGALEKAQPFLNRAGERDPEYYRLHALRAQIASLEERDQDAVREENAALTHLPSSLPEGPLYAIQLHMNLVELYRHLADDSSAHGQLEIAQSQINALHEHGQDRSQFLRLRALIKMNTGDLTGAREDVQQALALNEKDTNSLQLSGDLLAKLDRPAEALAVYKKILAIDPSDRMALTAAGFVCRQLGRGRDAEKYFHQLAEAYPKLYTPHLALGDLYAAQRDFSEADAAYQKAYALAPKNPMVVAGAMNAAIEAHRLSLAEQWLKRADDPMQANPYVMREKERYLRLTDQYAQSAEVGEQALTKLPRDRDVVVYLGYDLLHLQRYDDLVELASQYDGVFPQDPDVALLAGYAHKHFGQLDKAERDFTQALHRNPRIPTAYVNRGFLFNDLHQPKPAAADFESALKLEPDNGEAHLGLAYASLSLHRPHAALHQVQLAAAQLGDSLPVHLIRATAYGQEGLLNNAAREYRIALQYSSSDPALHLSLAHALEGLHDYREAIAELQIAEKLSPSEAAILAELARSYAHLGDNKNTLLNVHLAEQHMQTSDPKQQSATLIVMGDALDLLGDHDAATSRFASALDLPGCDRVGVRLALAQLMASRGATDDARRQVALGFMEARAGDTSPPTAEQLMQAGNIFLDTHDFQLAENYLQKALAAGAPETDVRIGLANGYLALGDTPRAQAQVSAIASNAEGEPKYEYLLAKANLLQQQHQNVQALTAFAQAASAAGEDQTAEQELIQAAGNEGLRINRHLSFISDFSLDPIFEDTTVYPLDAKLDVPNPIPGRQGLLPLPRSSIETQWTGAYHLHIADLPNAGGFFQVRNARGEISLPSADAIVNRDTTDYAFNFGVNPTLHLGDNVFSFNTGVQETIRRDSRDPYDMNQNLFRQFVYLSTSSFYNMVSVSGFIIRETGPFTESSLHSRDLSGTVNFRVGPPWGNTAVVTGWGARDVQFFPVIREFYDTSAYLGVEHRFSQRLQLRMVAEDLRAWRVEGNQFAVAQALRPAGSVQYSPTRNWTFEATAAYSRNMSFHAYDAVQSGFAISYAMPIHRTFKDEGNQVELQYPIRFSAGMQQESFYNFPGPSSQQFRPYVRITLF